MIPQYVGVNIYTKKSLKAFLENNFGNPVRFDRNCVFHNPLILCLSHEHVQHIDRIEDYPLPLKVHIPFDVYERYGSYMNDVKLKYFNSIVEQYMKLLFVSYADTYLKISPDPTFVKARDYAMDMIRVTDEDWDFDSAKRFYHRYRLRNGLPLLYNNRKKLSGKVSLLKKDKNYSNGQI